jgi:hypothetical protein
MKKRNSKPKKRLIFGLAATGMLLSFLFLFTGCKDREITNFPDAIEKYGFKSSKPLSGKETAVDNNLLGGYVYNSLPLILSRKDNYTYLITFLSTELDRADEAIEAHMTVIGDDQYLNLDLGNTYAFLKVVSTFNNSLQVKLLRNTIGTYVKDNLKNWLVKNGGQEDIEDENGLSVSIYYMFTFEKVTPERAKEIQAGQLLLKKTELFNSCADYVAYAALETRFPNDPMLTFARKNLLDKCSTIEDYNVFIARFAGDPLCEEAKKRIYDLNRRLADSLNYAGAIKTNTIAGYEQFISGSSTAAFKDSAKYRILNLVNAINEDNIEWKWTSEKRSEAIQYIFYKIDYTPGNINKEWYLKHLTLYCLLDTTKENKEKGLSYLDKMVQNNPSKDELLNLYLSKGFLSWSLEKYDLALEVFKSKIGEVYTGEEKMIFRKKIKLQYKDYKQQRIFFPKEKETWKAIRKL